MHPEDNYTQIRCVCVGVLYEKVCLCMCDEDTFLRVMTVFIFYFLRIIIYVIITYTCRRMLVEGCFSVSTIPPKIHIGLAVWVRVVLLLSLLVSNRNDEQ